MECKAKRISAILATAIVALVASAAVTYVNIGPRADLPRCWLSASAVGCSAALAAAYLACPLVRSATLHSIASIDSGGV